MATTKHKFQRLVFNPENQNLNDFLDGLQKLAKNAFGVTVQAVIEQLIYANILPHLKKSINQAQLKNGTHEKIVLHLERELDLNCLEAPDELQVNTVTQQPKQQNPEKPKTTLPPLKKARSLSNPVPSTQTQNRPSSKQRE